jgi:transposase InsO family protein
MMMVVTDRLGKGCKLIPMRRTEAVDVAWAFIQNVYCNHGFPDAIVSDRGRQFVSDLWRELCTLLQVKQRLSSAYHPETDGSTERMNSTTETVVRTYVNEDQNN